MNHNEQITVLQTAVDWLKSGSGATLVTVAASSGSAPRPIGSMAVVRDDGAMAGSVSGGCIEKQLAERFARRAPERPTGQLSDQSRERPTGHLPDQLSDGAGYRATDVTGDGPDDQQSRALSAGRAGGVERFLIDNETAQRFGLSCGGELELVFEHLRHPAGLEQILARLEQRQYTERHVQLDGAAAPVIQPSTRGQAFHYDGARMVQQFGPGWRLLLIGAAQLSRYTARFALATDFEVIVCEPRESFALAWNEPGSLLVTESPDDAVRRYAQDDKSAVLALSHDPNLDDLALLEALPSACFYVGMLGSRKTADRARHRLTGLGLTVAELERLQAPIGLPINSRTSAEIAVSVIAQVISVRAAETSPAASSPAAIQ